MRGRAMIAVAALALAALAWPAVVSAGAPQFGKPSLGQIKKRVQQVRELTITEADELKIGEAVSERVRVRYGVVQDPAVHRYVSLVGLVIAAETSRPNLPWRFIVLDTDGVNAFAAPGGYIHITRGALGLMGSETELANVLAHEIEHVVGKHTIRAIQKSKVAEIGAEETLGDSKVFSRIVDATAEMVLAGFGRGEELESDKAGVRLANRVGYSPKGLADFLTRLSNRNKAATEKQGLFASHPEMKERLDRLASQVASEKLTSTATLEDRYRRNISYKAAERAGVAAVAPGAAGLAAGGKEAASDDKQAEGEKPKRKGLGLASVLKPVGSEKKSAEVVGSGASRGVDTERNARGGAVSALVAVSVKPADIEAFKKEGNLK